MQESWASPFAQARGEVECDSAKHLWASLIQPQFFSTKSCMVSKADANAHVQKQRMKAWRKEGSPLLTGANYHG